MPIGYMRLSMLYNYSNKAGTIHPYLSARTCWRVIGNIAIFTRRACSTCDGGKPQAAARQAHNVSLLL